jgi:uncharacterized RDD family membrane protein YckC
MPQKIIKKALEFQNLPKTIRDLQEPHKLLILRRFGARLIDLSIALLLNILLKAPLGTILGFLFNLFSDGIPFAPLKNHSPGKYLLGLKVTRFQKSLTLKDSLLRNLTLAFPLLLIAAGIYGWILFVLIGAPLALAELLMIIHHPHQKRLGDLLAETQVELATHHEP